MKKPSSTCLASYRGKKHQEKNSWMTKDRNKKETRKKEKTKREHDTKSIIWSTFLFLVKFEYFEILSFRALNKSQITCLSVLINWLPSIICPMCGL